MPKLKPGAIWPTDEEDRAINKAAMSDPDSIPLTNEEWEQVKPLLKRSRKRKWSKIVSPFVYRMR